MREVVDRYFGSELGADVAAMEVGDVVVQRTPRREGASVFAGRGEEEAPVWILVTRGRGVVSCSRLLYRVACAWAEDFAAADHLLRREFLEDLRAEVARSMDAEVRVEMWRVFTGGPGLPESATVRPAVDAPVALCAAEDRDAARALLEAGAREYGRMARLVARR